MKHVYSKIHAEKSSQNLVNPNRIWIVIILFQIDLTPIAIPIGAKSIGKRFLKSKFT